MSTRLNLLPWREMRRREQDRQLLTIGIGAWVLMGLIVFYAHLHVSGLIEEQNRRNDYLKAEIAKVEAEIKEIANIKKQRQDLIARMNIIYELQGDRARVVRIFDELVRRLPEGVQLTTFDQKAAAISLKGVAQSNARVSALMRNLASSEVFDSPELEVINVKERGRERVSEFALKVKHGKPKEAAPQAAATDKGPT